MSYSLTAVIPHKRLMELKGCGAVMPSVIGELVENIYRSAIDRMTDAEMEKFTIKFFSPSRKTVKYRQERMFDPAEEMVNHLYAVNCTSQLVHMTEEEQKDMVFLYKAETAARRCQEVLELFRNHDEVTADAATCGMVDWLIRNERVIRKIVEEKGQ